MMNDNFRYDENIDITELSNGYFLVRLEFDILNRAIKECFKSFCENQYFNTRSELLDFLTYITADNENEYVDVLKELYITSIKGKWDETLFGKLDIPIFSGT